MSLAAKVKKIVRREAREQKKKSLIAAVRSDGALPEAVKAELIEAIQSDSLTPERIDSLIKRRREAHKNERAVADAEYERKRASSVWVIGGDTRKARKDYRALTREVLRIETVFERFNKLLSALGSFWGLLFIMLATMALSIIWTEKTFGLDFLGGNVYISTGVVVALLFLIDSVSLALMTGLLAAVDSLIDNPVRALKVQHMIIAGLTGTAVVSFAVFVYGRMVGITL